ncbi:MAG: serine/threonine protein kinase [Acidobacteriota bacterium]|jgi:hypothetical protein
MSQPSRGNVHRHGGLTTTTGRLAAMGFRFWFIPLLAVLIGGVGWWTRTEIEATLKERIEQNLVTILDTDVEALEFWLESKRDAALVLADRTTVRGLVTELVTAVQERGESPEALRTIAATAPLREYLSSAMEHYSFGGFGVISRSGLLLATANDAYTGLRFDVDQLALIEAAYRGEAGVSRPFHASFEVNDNAALPAGVPMMFVIAPVRDPSGEIISTLGFVIDVNEFSSVLEIARPGESGETYAFDRDGVLLSNSRFEDELRDIGLLPEDDAVHSVLNIAIRNPGGDLTRDFVPTVDRRAQPLTLAAAAAVSGEDGFNVDGYRDYRGVHVVGAWRWLDRYGFGVATEEDHTEAYAALNRLRSIQLGLVALVVLAAVAMVLESVVISRLGRKVSEAVEEARQLGQYTLEKKIGEGGMGAVYRARHAMLRRPTAIKLLRPDRAGETDIARFEREVQLTAKLTHPNTIAIYDFGRTPDNVFYYAMEYLHGINLQDLGEKTGPQPPGRVINVLQQACGSLAEAHGIGLIHRDIKPANIILCERGGSYDVVKVVDFGIVKDVGAHAEAQLTQAGAFSGTPLYIAPETIRASEDVDARVDVYALGAVGYYMLTGRPIFDDTLSAVDILTRQMTEIPPPPSRVVEVTIPAELEQIIMRCLAKDPDARPAGAAALLDELDALEDAGTWGAREARKWWAIHADLVGFSTTGGTTAEHSERGQTIAIDMQERDQTTAIDTE